MPNQPSVAKRGEICPRCGVVHPGCLSHSSRTGKACQRELTPGSEVCYTHGAASPQVRKKVAEAESRAAAVAAVRAYGLRIDVDPIDAILDEIAWTNGHVQWLRGKVQSLEEEDLVWGVAEEAEKLAGEFPGTDTLRKATPNVWLSLYQAERKHLVEVCATAAKLGIEERRVKLAERLGGMIAEFINRLLGDPDFGLTPEKQEVGRLVAARHLRLLAAVE